jgi:restriction system protein
MMSMIWWLNTAVARVLSRFLRGAFGMLVHFFVMGYIYDGILRLVSRVVDALPLPAPTIAQPDFQGMSTQEVFALFLASPSLMAALVLTLVVWVGIFLLQIVGTFKAANIYNGREDASSDGRSVQRSPARNAPWTVGSGSMFIGVIAAIFAVGATLLVWREGATWVAVLSLVALGYLSHIRRKEARVKLRRSGINKIDMMSGVEFEQFLARFFEEQGYHVRTTPEYNDYGADLFLSKDGITTVVQAKRWLRVVGIEAVREALGAKEFYKKDYKIDEAMVVTSSAFTPTAIEFARGTKVTLWDRRVLFEKLRAAKFLPIVDDPEAYFRTCPECGSLLVECRGSFGPFYGCSAFPNCEYTRAR